MLSTSQAPDPRNDMRENKCVAPRFCLLCYGFLPAQQTRFPFFSHFRGRKAVATVGAWRRGRVNKLSERLGQWALSPFFGWSFCRWEAAIVFSCVAGGGKQWLGNSVTTRRGVCCPLLLIVIPYNRCCALLVIHHGLLRIFTLGGLTPLVTDAGLE